MKKAFTLAEILIVLAVIGVITAILLPAARHVTPDENALKFKKAHNMFHTAIRELVNSDKYYLDGDLGIRADGKKLNHELGDENIKYFCQTLADVLNAKSVNCHVELNSYGHVTLGKDESNTNIWSEPGWSSNIVYKVTDESIASAKAKVDNYCKITAPLYNDEIVLADGVHIFSSTPRMTFAQYSMSTRVFSPPNQFPANARDEMGFDVAYKPVCIDIDGVPENATADECVNECPFGYGIRADGKILNGARAEEWLQKSIQNKD